MSRIQTLTIILMICFFSPYLVGQEKKNTVIYGTVSDELNQPLEGVKVTLGNFYTLTRENGSYRMEVNHGKNLVVYFTSFGYRPDTVVISLDKGDELQVDKRIELLPNFLDNIEIIDKKARFDNQVNIKSKDIDAYVGPESGVEGIIKTLPGVSSYNELSSQYSVRGGNFDENLVYINGIEVYRSFLVRNGQQEGLSIVNPDMVDDISFSAGGFAARYGDRMSSVLDITYRRPTDFGLKVRASLLGGAITYQDRVFNERLAVITSARYRTNQILLGSLDTEADFRPQFTDIQAYLTYYLTDEWDISFLGNFSRNIYQVIPDTRTTDFGTFQEALQLQVFFDGQENYDFTTRFGAFQATNRPSRNLELKYTVSAFQTSEQEYFDVLGAYRLGELNTNLGSDEFGEIAVVRGTGGFQNYARNNLDAIVANVDHTGLYDKDEVSWRWGLKFQYEDIVDGYKEWERIDSAGYSIPHGRSWRFDSIIATVVDDDGNVLAGNIVIADSLVNDDLDLFESFDSRASIQSWRVMAFVERSQLIQKWDQDFYINVGVRTNYWTFNNQNVFSPRASLSWMPNWEKDMVFRISGGWYFQPPFYREMRDLEGGINEDIVAQESIHLVLGNDYQLKIWDRPFKMVTEGLLQEL